MNRVIPLGMNLRIANLLVFTLMAGAHLLSATTLVVGNCKGSSPYSTIQAAIDAAPVGAVVQVCPDNYYEQVTITQAVTLEGITSDNDDLVVISPPSGGLTQTTINAYGTLVAYQVLAQNASGPVNISNIYVSGSNEGFLGAYIAGIFYQNVRGTIDGAVTEGQSGNGNGVGIWLEGGSSSPSVTVKNSFAHGVDYAGIFAETAYQGASALTAKITANYLTSNGAAGIFIGQGSTSTVSNNVVDCNSIPQANGILVVSPADGSVSGNAISNCTYGISSNADAVAVTTNTVVDSFYGIYLQSAVETVKSNSFIGNNIAIEFSCYANPHVVSNTINNGYVGLDHVPSGLGTTTNKVFNIYGTIKTSGC